MAKRAPGPAAASTHALSNAQIADALREMALFLQMHDVPHRPRAYENAALGVASHDDSLTDMYQRGGERALAEVEGVGKGIAQRIGELLRTGHCKELDQLREETPVDVLGLTSVRGLGPKHVKQLYEALRVRTLEELEEAASHGRIHELPHFGERSEQKILEGVSFVRQARGRVSLGTALPLARELLEPLRRLPHVSHAEIAGSVRRRRETIGDIDLLVASSQPEAVMQAFAELPQLAELSSRGPTKSSARTHAGLLVDLRVIPAESWGAALCYFTGSKAHNIALRRIAQDRGLKLSEYGLFRGARQLAGDTEHAIYAALDLPWIAPELREARGEIEAARAGTLPELIDYGALRGDLHVHTDASDGRDSLQAMVLAAKQLGLRYVAITDHTRDLPMTGGADEAQLLQHAAAVRAIAARVSGIRVLAGAEVNVRSDGSLDIADAVLAQLDVVGAGVHAHFEQPRAELTARLIRAVENPHVDYLAHPTSRLLGRRRPADVDFDALFAAARRARTALEIDGQPERLDLDDEHVRRAIAAGVPLVIGSDAHGVSELRFASEYGVAVARRGWARASDVLNTQPWTRVQAALKTR